jgi:hypothetical protein
VSGGLDVLHARVALRHRAAIDVLDLALRFVVVHARIYGLLVLFTIVPGIFAASAVGLSAGWLRGWLVAFAWAGLAHTPFTIAASRLVFEDHVSARDALAAAMRESPRVVWLRLVLLTTFVVGVLFFLVPAVIVAVAGAFAMEVLLLERARVLGALARSPSIVAGDVGEALLVVVASSAVYVAGALVGDVAGRALVQELLLFRPPGSLFSEGGSVLAFTGFLGVVPFVATARFFVYLNLRTRAEGWDIQIRFAALARRAR